MFEKFYKMINEVLNKLRIITLKLRGAKIGDNVRSYGPFSVVKAEKLIIGDRTTINDGVHFNCRDFIFIGRECRISTNVQLHTGRLILNEQPRVHTQSPIIIEDNVWIASGSVISSGVRIGKNSVIGANSVVLSDVKSNSFYAGNPAKKIKDI